MCSIKGYDNNLYCDICNSKIDRGEEYFCHDSRDVIMCSSDCFEKYAIEYMEDEVAYCYND